MSRRYAISSFVSSRHAPLLRCGSRRHRAHCHTLEAANLQTALLAHFANLAVAALVNGQAQLGAQLIAVDDNDRGRLDAVAIDLHRLCQQGMLVEIAARAPRSASRPRDTDGSAR